MKNKPTTHAEFHPDWTRHTSSLEALCDSLTETVLFGWNDLTRNHTLVKRCCCYVFRDIKYEEGKESSVRAYFWNNTTAEEIKRALYQASKSL